MKYLLCRVRCLLRYDVLSVSTKKGAREREMARERCTDLCTKEASGQCAHCDALDDRDRFERPFRAVVTPCVKGLRWLRAHATPVLLTVVSLGFLGPIIYAWWLQLDQLDQPITCHVILEKLQERNSGLDIRLTEHHSSEPLFSGKLHFISVDPRHAGVSTVTVTRSQTTRWNILRPQVPEDFEFVAETGSH
jgi:hypothetical protein